MALAGNQDDPARESVFAQSLDCCVSRRPATDNDKHAFVVRLALRHGQHSAIFRIHRNVDKNFPILYSHRKTWKRVERRWFFQVARDGVETSMVPGTDDTLAIDYAVHQWCAVMSTVRCDCVIVSLDPRQQNLGTGGRDLFHLAISKFVSCGNCLFSIRHKELSYFPNRFGSY